VLLVRKDGSRRDHIGGFKKDVNRGWAHKIFGTAKLYRERKPFGGKKPGLNWENPPGFKGNPPFGDQKPPGI